MAEKREMATEREIYEVWCISKSDGKTYLHLGNFYANDVEEAKRFMASAVSIIMMGNEALRISTELSEVVGPNFLEEHGVTLDELRKLADISDLDFVQNWPLQLEPWAPELRFRTWISGD